MKENVYYYGYWMNFGYFVEFRDRFLDEFVFPELRDNSNIEYLNLINKTNSESIHIRRGDFVNLGLAISESIIHSMINNYINDHGRDWVLFVFSDDICWCKENSIILGLNSFAKVIYVEGNIKQNNYIDMQLMSHCKGMIFSNSSFCKMAFLLNKNETIVV